MKVLSIEAFVPSGPDFEIAKQFFQELGFTINWDVDGYTGFQHGDCRFILQRYDVPEFAQNLMFSVKIDNVAALRDEVLAKQLPERYGIRISDIKQEPYGKEMNLIDMAGVCWHFVEQ